MNTLDELKRDLDTLDSAYKDSWAAYRRYFTDRNEPIPWYCPNSGNVYSLIAAGVVPFVGVESPRLTWVNS